MKKLFFLLLPVLMLFAACKQQTATNPHDDTLKIWLFDTNTTYENALSILTEKRYEPIEVSQDTPMGKLSLLGNDKYIVDYLGIDWDSFIIAFNNDKLVGVSFNHYSGGRVKDKQIWGILKGLDKTFGEHREDRTEKHDVFKGQPTTWTWVKDNFNVRLNISTANIENDIVILEFLDEDYSKDLLNYIK